MSNETEEVRVGTLKLLSERITELQEEVSKLEGIVRKQRGQLARYGHHEGRELCQENGSLSLAAAAQGY